MKTRKTKLVERATKNSTKGNNLYKKSNCTVKPNKIKIENPRKQSINQFKILEETTHKISVDEDTVLQSSNNNSNVMTNLNKISVIDDQSYKKKFLGFPKHEYESDSSDTDTEDEDDDMSIEEKNYNTQDCKPITNKSVYPNSNATLKQNKNEIDNKSGDLLVTSVHNFVNVKTEIEFNNKLIGNLDCDLYNYNDVSKLAPAVSRNQNVISTVYESKIQAYTRAYIFRGLKIVTNDHFHPKCELMPKLLDLVDYDEEHNPNTKEAYMMALKKIVKDTLNNKRGHVKRKMAHELQGMCTFKTLKLFINKMLAYIVRF
jgi:hypothetical protein